MHDDRVRFWYTGRCDCTRPTPYRAYDHYPPRCAKCGGHIYTQPRAFHFERISREPVIDIRAILRLLGLGLLALLGWLLVALCFIVFGGQ